VLQAAADRGVFVAVLRRSGPTGIASEVRAIDLASGATSVVLPLTPLELLIEDVREAVVLLRETEDLGGGDAHVRLLAVPWRAPADPQVLEEEDLGGLQGGRNWDPWPYARTNGREIVWLRGGDVFAPHEIVLAAAGGQPRTIATADQPVYFDLDETGRVAIATRTTDGARQNLQLYDGVRLRPLGSRAAADGGYVLSFADTVGWARGDGIARPVTEVELVPAAGGDSRSARAESGCIVLGATSQELATVCSSGVRLLDVATGVARDGPAGRIALAFRRAIVWQTLADFTANPQVWRITLL
jgi:hypothetical protein